MSLPPAGGDGEPDRSQHQTVVRLRGEGQGQHPAGRDVPEESAQGTYESRLREKSVKISSLVTLLRISVTVQKKIWIAVCLAVLILILVIALLSAFGT